jgi:hypothetical protein
MRDGRASRLHVSIDQERIPIRVQHDEAGRSRGALVGLLLERHAARSQLTLQLAHVGERVVFLRVAGPAGLKVRMFFSNMPWNSPITCSPFFRISQLCSALPPKTVKPNVS